MAKKKFDTNPLDPDFPRRVTAQQAQTAQDFEVETKPISRPAPAEEPTRRYETNGFSQYEQPFDGRNVPEAYQTARFAGIHDEGNSSRKVEGAGLPEKWLIALPYIPWYIGLVASVIILLVVPQSETRVRFHAAQGLAAHLAILIVSAILGAAGNVTGVARGANAIFNIVTAIMLIIFAVKAWQGKPVHIESVDDLTEWVEDKIKPRK